MDAFAERTDLPLAAVIGGCGGMGLACARRLGQRHAVMLVDIDAERLEIVAAELRRENHVVLPIVCDVSSSDSIASLAATIAAKGRLRAVAHVVALSPSMADWRRIMDVNLVGAANMADALLPLMEKGGAAVFVSSIGGHMGQYDKALLTTLDDPQSPDFMSALVRVLGREPNTVESYCLSKLGLMRMCRRLALQWGGAGARILSLSPGFIASPMGLREAREQPQRQLLVERTPLARQGTLIEIADAMEFLCSDRASFISGTDILVDGGCAAAHEYPADTATRRAAA